MSDGIARTSSRDRISIGFAFQGKVMYNIRGGLIARGDYSMILKFTRAFRGKSGVEEAETKTLSRPRRKTLLNKTFPSK